MSDSTIYRAIAAGRFDGLIGGRRAACRLRRKGRLFLIEYFFVKSQNKSFGFHGKFFAA
ncbi:MAG: hypothetical protein SPK07_10155 [Coriobacteriales bacterium]|nr:hypothetical protein [Coriobacteriales bacterium]